MKFVREHDPQAEIQVKVFGEDHRIIGGSGSFTIPVLMNFDDYLSSNKALFSKGDGNYMFTIHHITFAGDYSDSMFDIEEIWFQPFGEDVAIYSVSQKTGNVVSLFADRGQA